ncbi:MAG: T9SS type A sorting domain-containing protein [Sporocytophaga sp.]|uniref:LamG-like jellyroll fold domain-containing protein n=1 Tax=Sporocytophaga sp. TaxID=2231183 RepID=UPI001B2F5717|nr:LamG-like jellyroll fold domain-containing protein [Sporocytophaga sp.]MBO9698942.1 T9SS type A sorting domain-containing protein [Sporocytophaga sp.]
MRTKQTFFHNEKSQSERKVIELMCYASSGSFFWFFLIVFVTFNRSLSAQSCGCDYTIPSGSTIIDRNTLSVTTLPKNKRVICFQSGTRTAPLMVKNFKGSTDGGINAPYIFKNCSAQVVFNIALSNGYAFKFFNSENVRLSGTGSSDQYGIVLSGANITLVLGDTTTKVEIDHVDIRNSGFCGLMAKTDNALAKVVGGNNNPAGFVMKNIYIHDNYIYNTDAEGMYIGNTNWAPGNTQHNLDSVFVYNNIVRDAGAEGIQIGDCPSGRAYVYNNYINGFGRKYQTFALYQNNGLQLSTGFSGRCYNNFIYGYPGDEFTQNGLVCVGLGNVYIYNNVVVNAKDNGIYVGSNNAESKAKPFYVFNNTIVNPSHDGIRLQEVGSAVNKISAFVYNNLGANIPAGYSLVKRASPLISSSEVANISNTIPAFNFQDPDNNDYNLTENSNLVIDLGTNIVASYGLTSDIDGNLRAPQGGAFDVGAYEYVSDFLLTVDPQSLIGKCIGDTFMLSYSGTNTGWPSDVTYKASLSGPDGYFGPQRIIVGSNDSLSGQIKSALPDNIPQGNNYRVRIEASNNSGFFRAGPESSIGLARMEALQFRSPQRASVSNSSLFAPGIGDFTIEARVKMDFSATDNNMLEIVSTRAIGNTSKGYMFGFNYATGKIVFNFFNEFGVNVNIQSNTLSLSDMRNDGAWHHLSVSRSAGNKFTFFLDGYSVGVQIYNVDLSVASNYLFIGYDEPGNAGMSSFTGSIDYLRFWNVAKTEIELINNLKMDFPYPSNGLLGLWNFNECSGVQAILDDSPYGNDGWLGMNSDIGTNDPSRTIGSDKAESFRGLDFNSVVAGKLDVATIPHNVNYNFQTNFSLEAYINLKNPLKGTRTVIYEKDTTNGVRFYVADANHLGLVIGGMTVLSDVVQKNNVTANLYSGGCYAVAVTATQSGTSYIIRFYLDGLLVGTSKFVSGTNAFTSESNALIGCDAAQSIPANGYITEVKLWKTARTADEIKNNLGVVFSSITVNLAGYWRFKEINGQTLIDQSANNNAGYLGESLAVESTADPQRSDNRCHFNDRVDTLPVPDSLISEDMKVAVYPNPFSSEFGVVITGRMGESSDFYMFDLAGRLVFEKLGIKNNELAVLSPDLYGGMYLVKVVKGGQVQFVKVIKTH